MKMRALFLFGLSTIITGCGPSSGQIENAKAQCANFVHTQLNRNMEHIKVFDYWEKDGKIVVDVGYIDHFNDVGRDSYSMRLCVYDEAAGTISLPSILNDSAWRK